MSEIVGYGSYIPCWRIERSAITKALGMAVVRGSRSVASFDEDTTTMAVGAARAALAQLPEFWSPSNIIFSTANPVYADKTNCTAIAAALGLSSSIGAYDFHGSVRSTAGALKFAHGIQTSSLLTISDIRCGMPGGSDELNGGDAAACFAFGDGPALATLLGSASTSEEFLERWRKPGDYASKLWEERFGETAYVPLAATAIGQALKSAEITPEDIDHLIVAGLHSRAVRAVISSMGVKSGAVVKDMTSVIGNCGSAHSGVLLADVFDRALPGDRIAVVQLSDGADAFVYEVSEQILAYRAGGGTTVQNQILSNRTGLSYETFLTWRGILVREPPRRPDPDSPAGPPALRNVNWKFAFTANRCLSCGTRHLSPTRVCSNCHSLDQLVAESMSAVSGTIVTFTIDHLAYSLSPPTVTAIIDFDGGGRMGLEVADVEIDEVRIGQRVQMTFRLLYSSTSGVHNYFWKARIMREGD